MSTSDGYISHGTPLIIYNYIPQYPINVGKTIINHAPVITIFMGGTVTIPSHGWFMALF
jgi:hypothetical protein